MPEFSEEQTRIIARLDRAMKDAAKAGLAMRVFDGAVLILKADALKDAFGEEYAHWADEHIQQIGIGLDADGGAGSWPTTSTATPGRNLEAEDLPRYAMTRRQLNEDRPCVYRITFKRKGHDDNRAEFPGGTP